ncbi:MAG: tetratricopeptide repeat protein [Gammaproteobacteria bacterium]
MLKPTSETVLGDFDAAEFDRQDVASRFDRREDQYYVTTDNSEGVPEEFPVRYTFGVEPLQQYLVEMSDGKIQASSLAWDSRRAEDGGQRWFHVYGDEPIDHTDVLHWTRSSQNWETMCADCHSTELVKNYDVEADRFDTTFAEINVACEACHGPGSEHLAWAEKPDDSADRGLQLALDERLDVSWVLDPATGNSQRSAPRQTSREINACAGCHSRRSRIADSTWAAGVYLDNYQPAFIQPPLYHADGQVLDEVYVYGSFLQSRMYQQGVTCSDCHEPHSLQLRAPGEQVCQQCHDASRFAASEHHLHEPNSAGADCIACHMPPSTFMQVDVRHDHSFRIPRPELAVEFGTPLVCLDCHTDQDAEWAMQALAGAGKLRQDSASHWSRRLAGAEALPLEARNLRLGLVADALVPNIIRSSAMTRLDLSRDALGATVVGEQLQSRDPLLRLGAAIAMQTASPAARVQFGPTILADPVKAVRLAGAMVMAPLGPEALPPRAQQDFNQVTQEYVAAQLVNAERAPAHINIANLERHLGRDDRAVQAYRTAIRLNASYVPAYVNLSDLYRQQGDEAAAEQVLREGLEQEPAQAALWHALGLGLVRQGRSEEAYEALRIAADSPDATPRFALAMGLIMDAQGEAAAALTYLEASLQRFPDDPGLIAALANLYQRSGQTEKALEFGGRLQR